MYGGIYLLIYLWYWIWTQGLCLCSTIWHMLRPFCFLIFESNLCFSPGLAIDRYPVTSGSWVVGTTDIHDHTALLAEIGLPNFWSSPDFKYHPNIYTFQVAGLQACTTMSSLAKFVIWDVPIFPLELALKAFPPISCLPSSWNYRNNLLCPPLNTKFYMWKVYHAVIKSI
jgi:hypothetical protein